MGFEQLWATMSAKILRDSTSQHLFLNFPKGHAPRHPLEKACFLCSQCVKYAMPITAVECDQALMMSFKPPSFFSSMF